MTTTDGNCRIARTKTSCARSSASLNDTLRQQNPVNHAGELFVKRTESRAVSGLRGADQRGFVDAQLNGHRISSEWLVPAGTTTAVTYFP